MYFLKNDLYAVRLGCHMNGITDSMKLNLGTNSRTGEGQGCLACCISWSLKELDMASNWTQEHAVWVVLEITAEFKKPRGGVKGIKILISHFKNKLWKFISHSSGGWKSKDRVLAWDCLPGEDPLSHFHLLVVSSHGWRASHWILLSQIFMCIGPE